MKSNYKKLGEFIKPVDVRNRNGFKMQLLGVSVEKYFIKSIANTVGTDWSDYKIIKKGQFCYIPDTSRRGDKIGIALLDTYAEALVSQAYSVFEIERTDELLPEYLMLWFKRPEFDRYARFHSHGSVREIFDWEEMCNVELPVPSIEEQKKIVKSYQAIENRISILRQINDNLESQAYAIYKTLFNSDNLMQGKIFDLAINIVCGKTPSTKETSNFIGDIPFITIPDMHGNVFVISTERKLSLQAATNVIPANSICVSCIASAGLVVLTDTISQTNQQINSIVCKESISPYYVYFQMKELSDYIKQIGSCGSTTCNLSKTGFSSIEIQIPQTDAQAAYTHQVEPIFQTIKSNQKEILMLGNARSMLLSKLSN